MGLLNLTNDGLPSVGITVTRYVARFGPTSRPDIVSHVAPPNLSTTAADKVSQILTRWTQLGVFREAEGLYAIADTSVRQEIRIAHSPLHPVLRAYVLSRVMGVAAAAEGLDESHPADDFVLAAKWLLSSNPFKNPVHSWVEAERLSMPLKNNTRWPGCVEWMSFLGLGETFGQRGWLLPNPAEAIGWYLPEIAGGEEDMPWRVFIERLNRTVPLVPTGHDGGGLPVVTSLALQSLSDEGRIVLRVEADASTLALIHPSGRKHREFSHVTLIS